MIQFIKDYLFFQYCVKGQQGCTVSRGSRAAAQASVKVPVRGCTTIP